MSYRIIKRTNPNNINWPYYIPQYSTKFLYFFTIWNSFIDWNKLGSSSERKFFSLTEAKEFINSEIKHSHSIKKIEIKEEIVLEINAG